MFVNGHNILVLDIQSVIIIVFCGDFSLLNWFILGWCMVHTGPGANQNPV